MPSTLVPSAASAFEPNLTTTAESLASISLSALLGQIKAAVTRAVPSQVWVRLETDSVNTKNGHIYIGAIERDDDHQIVARAQCALWRSNADRLNSLFQSATGSKLAAGMKILVRVKAEFSPAHGLCLVVSDIDPAYTIGEHALRLKKIRADLLAKGCHDYNKRLPHPVDFFRAGVIAPKGAAGLDDFKKEADRLQHAGLCTFVYYDEAPFQGPGAEQAIRDEMARAYSDHKRAPLDALVIIRGGGAASDLQWLDCHMVANAICKFPVPVITGIGHERDQCILDEYAQIRTGTPSKAIQYIIDHIVQRAVSAELFWNETVQTATHALHRADQAIESHHSAVAHGAETMLTRATHALDAAMSATYSAAHLLLQDGEAQVQALHSDVVASARHGLDRVSWEVEAEHDQVRTHAEHRLGRASQEAAAAHSLICASAERAWQQASAEIDALAKDIPFYAARQLQLAQASCKDLIKTVIAHGVDPTLKRGFALVRDAQGKPVSSCEAARNQVRLEIKFHDGSITR